MGDGLWAGERWKIHVKRGKLPRQVEFLTKQERFSCLSLQVGLLPWVETTSLREQQELQVESRATEDPLGMVSELADGCLEASKHFLGSRTLQP